MRCWNTRITQMSGPMSSNMAKTVSALDVRVPKWAVGNAKAMQGCWLLRHRRGRGIAQWGLAYRVGLSNAL